MRSWLIVRMIAGSALPIAPPVTAQKSGGSPQTTMVAMDYWFDVDAERVWTDTGLDFQRGIGFVYGGVRLWRPDCEFAVRCLRLVLQ